jgi:integrase
MSTITAAEIKLWQSEREKQVKFPTIQRAYGALKTMLNKAVDDGILEFNPLPTKSPLERPHFEETDQQLDAKNKRRLLTQEEVTRLFSGLEQFNNLKKEQRQRSIKHGKAYLESHDDKSFSHWAIPFTYLAYYTGMRAGDLKAITWQNLNLNFKRLSFTPSKTRHHPDPIVVSLELPRSIVEIMERWWRQSGKPSTGLVFPSDRIDGQLDKKAHLKPWKHIKALGGLPSELDFYALRHHWISTLIQTENILQVAKMAGHKTTKMIEAHYGHLAPDRTKGALAAFDVFGLDQNGFKEMVGEQ